MSYDLEVTNESARCWEEISSYITIKKVGNANYLYQIVRPKTLTLAYSGKLKLELDHRLVIAYSTNNGTDSNNHKLLFYGQDWIDAFCNFGGPDCIYYLRSFAPVRVVFKHCKVKRTKRPCAYYSNTCATFHCTLEGGLVFKLNPGPVNNSDHSIIQPYCSLRRRAPSNTRVDRS